MTDRIDPIEAVRQLDLFDGDRLASDWAASSVSTVVLDEITAGDLTSREVGSLDQEAHAGLLVRASVGLGTAAALVAVATVVILAWPSGLPPALAGWTTEPQPVPADVRQRLMDHCQSDPEHLPEQLDPETVAVLSNSGQPDLIDHRGGAAVARWHHVNGDKQVEFECLVGDNDGDGE